MMVWSVGGMKCTVSCVYVLHSVRCVLCCVVCEGWPPPASRPALAHSTRPGAARSRPELGSGAAAAAETGRHTAVNMAQYVNISTCLNMS